MYHDTFKRLLEIAQQVAADAIVLGGDVVNFPHNRSVQHVLAALASRRVVGGARIPVLFTAGNHDWFVEGLPQSLREQRTRYRREVLKPLYQMVHRHRCGSTRDADLEDCGRLEFGHGDRRLVIVTIDNSIHEVSSAQAAFVWKELARGLPTLLMVHVPFMLPGSTPTNNKYILCGDARYGWDGDTSWNVERRERWPRGGTTVATRRFVEDVVNRFGAPQGPLIGILSGHEHSHRTDAVGPRPPTMPKLQCTDNSQPGQPPRCAAARGHEFGIPVHEGLVQYVTPGACDGGYRVVEVRDARVA